MIMILSVFRASTCVEQNEKFRQRFEIKLNQKDENHFQSIFALDTINMR